MNLRPSHPARVAFTLAASLGLALAAAQTPRGGTLTLAPGFLPDPQRVTGTTAGEIDAATLSPSCSGFVGRAPDHVLVLRAPEAWLRVFVSAASDTTLVIQRPDGSWSCNDDAFGRNPAVEGAFAAGRYAIYVGSYHAGVTAPYALSVTELRSNRP